MPRIDPERLLKTLAPLLESSSGAIKSNNEVDKIYGLMSKFSKKLVSKCTYINILKATQPEVLDLFLQRGGWDMILGWTSDASSKNNYDLLKEICGFLLYAPATIQRLKENELPKVVKLISKDCENGEIRELAKQVVVKWISVAKHNNFPVGSGNSVSTTTAHPSVPVQNSSITSTRITCQGDPEHPTADLDISAFDISQAELNAMIEFNPDDFTKAVDQHLDLSEAVASGNAIVHSIDNANVLVDSSDTIKIDLNNTPQVHTSQKFSINTSAGQNVVVRVEAQKQQEEPPYCIMMKDGKPFLVRLKLAAPKEVTELQNHSEITSTSSTGDLSPQKKKPANEPVDEKRLIKTYSKRAPVEVISALAQSPEITSKSKSGSKSKLSEPTDSSVKKQRSTSKGSSAAATAAAKKAADEEKLKEKIKQEKATLKKRAKDAAKQKQVEKDQETLKKLNLNMEPSVTAPPNNSRIPKIPKRQSSFADAIGIPGSSESDKTMKKKASLDSAEQSNDSISKNLNKPESSNEHKEKGKERRHQVKVFQSKKSRADDLLKDMAMTESVKSSKSNKSESSIKPNESSTLMGSNLIFKSEKRPSIEGMEKPGDSKKLKIDNKHHPKDKKPANLLKESSLFMDALTASYEPTKSSSKARKRRLSSTTNEKDDKLGKNSTNNFIKDRPPSSSPTLNNDSQLEVREVVKPIFNFYRETLDDDLDPTEKEPTVKETSPNTSMEQPMDISGDQDGIQSPVDDDDDEMTIIPNEVDLTPLKSVLVIHRSKGKPRKTVRWREDDELTETHTFELDEEERVNVTKHKDFLSAKEHEKAEEKQYIVKSLKQRMFNEDAEEKMPWRKPLLLQLIVEEPKIESKERDIQEERERLNLGVFLPPGSLLPDTASEPEISSPSEEERLECKIIPMEDVMNVTKVFDNCHMVWPRPRADHPSILHRVTKPLSSSQSNPRFGMSSGFGDMGFQHPSQNTQVGFPNVQNPMDFNNPWNTNTAPPLGGTNNVNINEMVRFPPTMNMNLPSGPIGFPPPTIPHPFGFPLQQNVPGFSPPLNFTNVPPPGSMILNNNIGASGSANTRGIPSILDGGLASRGSPRDYADRDLRRQLSRDLGGRDQDSRSRGGYDSRGRSRNDYSKGTKDNDRDRDHRDRRSPSPRRRRDERDRDRQDKDYRDEYRSRPRSGTKRDIPCRFFMKGHCQNGSRCDFSHDLDRSTLKNDSSKSVNSKRSLESWEDDNNQFERRPSTDTITEFADAPSSPTNDMILDPSLLPAKIIPVE